MNGIAIMSCKYLLLILTRSGTETARLIVLSLDAAGKTTFLYKIKPRHIEVDTTIPTIGFNVETLELSGFSLVCWDVGGCDKIRPLWRYYTTGSAMLVFVIDSHDIERIESARDELTTFLTDETLTGVPMLILANKQDLREHYPSRTLNVMQVIEQVGIDKIKDRQWFVQATCCTTGEGTFEALQWIQNTLFPAKYKPLKQHTAANIAFANGPYNMSSEIYFAQKMTTIGTTAASSSAQVAGIVLPPEEVLLSPHTTTEAHVVAQVNTVVVTNNDKTDSAESIAAKIAEAKRINDITIKQNTISAWLDRAAKEIDDATLHSITHSGDSNRASYTVLTIDQICLIAEDTFLQHVREYTLDSWDHYTHIRLGWIIIHRYCIRENKFFQDAFECVAAMISDFVAHSDRTNGKSFHRTMTYFWCHMIAYQMKLLSDNSSTDSGENVIARRDEFQAFLKSLYEPYAVDLWSTSLFKTYYSNPVLFGAEAKVTVVQPDLLPLPELGM